ncbi:hypothetical protein Tco_1344446 [Tanacetum coccineum]
MNFTMIEYLHVFGALCYPTNNGKDLAMVFNSKQFSSGPRPKLLTPGMISSGLYLNPPPCVDLQVPAVIAPEPVVSTGSPSLTTIDQDAPSSNELGGVLKNKTHLVARGYRQEEGIDFEESFALKFSKGTVDPTLFIKREGKDILLISQSPRGIFINQSKYALESLKKYGMETCDLVDTPMVEKSKLVEDPQGKAVDPTRYHGMIGTLMYLTSTFADADHTSCQDTKKGTSGSMQLLVPLLYTATTSNTPDPSILTLDITLSRSKWRTGWLRCILLEEYQLADIFTKRLARERLEFLINKLGMRSMSPETLKKLADEEEE